MKTFKKLTKMVGMQFEEAVELFGMETLESMQMVNVVGGGVAIQGNCGGVCQGNCGCQTGCVQTNCAGTCQTNCNVCTT
jgi:hypothetical protein